MIKRLLDDGVEVLCPFCAPKVLHKIRIGRVAATATAHNTTSRQLIALMARSGAAAAALGLAGSSATHPASHSVERGVQPYSTRVSPHTPTSLLLQCCTVFHGVTRGAFGAAPAGRTLLLLSLSIVRCRNSGRPCRSCCTSVAPHHRPPRAAAPPCRPFLAAHSVSAPSCASR